MPSFHALTRSALAAALLAGCADPVAPKGPVEHVVALSGGGQSGITLDTLPEHLVVRLVDDAGTPLAGRTVTWSSSDDAVRILPITQSTDASGTAHAIAVLGFAPGEQRIVARSPGFDETAVFTLEARSRPAFKAVSLMTGGGLEHMCAIDIGARAWCWGQNWAGQLGIGVVEALPAERLLPELVQTNQRFTRLVGLYGATCGITTTAELWCWGRNDLGLMEGGIQGSALPVRVAPGLRLRDFDADFPIGCGITVERDAYCWGRHILGDGSPSRTEPGFARVAGTERWTEITVGDSHVCATDEVFVVHCWGRAGLTGLESDALVPTSVPGLPPLTDLTSGWGLGTAPQCGIASGGLMVCWDGTSISSGRIAGMPVREVEIGTETAMARSSDGRLWIWGQPPECCDGGISGAPVPLEPKGPWLDFSTAGGAYAISAADSVLYRWTGFPPFGPPTGLLPTPIPAERSAP